MEEEKFRYIMDERLEEIDRKRKDLEEALTNFRKKIVTDFSDAIAGRFERIEKSIEELNYRIENTKFQSQIDEIKDKITQIERKGIEEEEMKIALQKLSGSEKEKIKLSRKSLDELRK